MTEFILVFVLAIALGWPLGRYLAAVMRGAPMPGDRVFSLIERPLYALLGTRPDRGMGWKDAEKTTLGKDWGEGPTLVEGVPFSIALPAMEGLTLRPLDPRGMAVGDLVKAVDGRFAVGPGQRTLWYALERAASGRPGA